MGTPQSPILTLPPQIKYATTGVPPPAPLYVDVNDQILLQAIASIPGINVQLNAKLLRPDGSISPMQMNAFPSGTRVTANVFAPLQEGFLLSATIVPNAALVYRGQCWARALLLRGYPAISFNGQVLSSGYISNTDFLTWPPGNYEPVRSGQGAIRSITGTTPGAGAEITEVVPAGATWRPILFQYSLTTSATVANRDSHLIVDDGSHVLGEHASGQVQAASLTNRWSWSPYGGGVVAANGVITIPFPFPVLMDTGYRLRTNTTNLQAGDQYTAPQYLVEEWLAP